MEKAKISPVVLQVLLREGVDPEAVSLLVRDQETGRRFFTDGISRRGYNFLIVTLDGGGWGWLSVGMAQEVKA